MSVANQKHDIDAWVSLAQSGSLQAQEQLLRQMQDRWFRFARTQTHSHDMAMEVTQETALRVLENLGRFGGQSSFSTWSLGIALNVCREFKHKARKQHQHKKSLLKLRWLTQKKSSEPDKALREAEDRSELARLLEQLSDRQKEVVTLRYFEGCDVEQTAGIMNVAPGTVKATLSQAISKLRKRWEATANHE